MSVITRLTVDVVGDVVSQVNLVYSILGNVISIKSEKDGQTLEYKFPANVVDMRRVESDKEIH